MYSSYILYILLVFILYPAMMVGNDYIDQPMHDQDLVSLAFIAMVNLCTLCFLNYNFLIILVCKLFMVKHSVLL